MPKNKTDNFLKAIKRYAGAQKRALAGEVKQLKTERLKEAEAKAKQDSERMKREKLAEARSRQAAAIASQTQTGQKELFVARSEMTEEVFRLAAEKLAAYTKTGAYRQKLAESAREIAKLFADMFGMPVKEGNSSNFVTDSDLKIQEFLSQKRA